MTARPPKQPRLRAALFASLALAAIVFACSMPAPDVVAPRANAAEATVIERVPAGQVMFEFQVETPAAANPTNKPPSYPAQLRTANIEGAVTASFVVDTNGKADMATFQVFKSDHDAFTNAVRQALPSMNFFPARVGDRTVKQLVMMPFSFSLVQGSTRPARVAGVIKELERVSAAVTAPSDDRQSVPTPLATNMPPVYPNQLRAANIEGQVIASFLVKADGTVDMSTFTVEKSDHDGFRAAVRDAVSSLRFKPAIGTGGAPIPQTLRMPFLFTLART